MSRLDDAQECCDLVHEHFYYVEDRDEHGNITEHWRDSSDKVLNGEQFEDDCDGFALTFLALLNRKYGFAKADLYIWGVDFYGDNNLNHAVAGFIHDNQMYCADNNHRFIYKQGDNFQTYLKFRCVAEKQWHNYAGSEVQSITIPG